MFRDNLEFRRLFVVPGFAARMSTLGLFGLALTMVSVIAAYYAGYRNGLADGRNLGFHEGKRTGAKEGSLRGFAVGFERGKRASAGGPSSEPKPPTRLGVKGLVWLVIAIAVVLLAATTRTSDTKRAPATHPSELNLSPDQR